MPRKYSYIYSELVTFPSDVIGLIAYALYKQTKIEAIESFKKKNGREPSESEIKNITDPLQLESQIKLYKDQAQSMFETISQEILNEELPTIEKKCVDKHAAMIDTCISQSLTKVLEKNEQGFGKQILIGVISCVCYSIVAFFASVVFMAQWPDAVKTLAEAFSKAN